MLTHDPNLSCGILFVDDEEKALKYFRLAFSPKFTVFTASSGSEGLETLRRESSRIGIVISDQRMPEMKGAEFLGLVRQEYPHIVRILTTAYSDLDSAIEAVNKGYIYQYVVKPWEVPELNMVLQRAADYYHVVTERNELLALKMTTMQRILCSDRLKWLLLSSRGWPEPEQAAFRRALIALVKALPDVWKPIVNHSDKFSPRRFEITSLLLDEYHNASKCLDLIDAIRRGSGPGERQLDVAAYPGIANGLQSLSAGSEAWQTLAASRLGAFLAALLADYQIAADDIQLSTEAGAIKLGLNRKVVPSDDLLHKLFGLLVQEKTPEISVLLFETLVALALGNTSLEITMGTSEDTAWTVTFSPRDAVDSTGEAISSLYEKFAAWDISRL